MSRVPNYSFYFQILLSLTLVLWISSLDRVESSGSRVERLPGFEGSLPFLLETGYVGLGEEGDDDDMQVFYYFIQSENDPRNDPLVLWQSGGPGCSSLAGIVDQIGPFKFKIEEYNGSLPNLEYRPQSWTKVANIIFVDLPFGAGFSYAKNAVALRSDRKLVHHSHQFLRKWLIDHPEFIPNKFFFGGDSYTGIPGPAIVQEISNGNEKGLQPWINLQGYLLGNPSTTGQEKNYQIPYAHGMGLISDELYLSLQRNCKGEYTNVDSKNELCLKDIDSFNECLSGVDMFYILESYCEDKDDDSPKIQEVLHRRSLTRKQNAIRSSSLKVPDIRCQTFKFFVVTEWANNEMVRESLHVRKGTIGEWQRCYRDDFEFDIPSSFEFHLNNSVKGYRSLIFSGDHDAIVPFLSTQAWIRALNYSIVDDWRSWHVDGQVAGYTRTYSNKMTFATLKGAGHTGAEYKPDEALAMFSRWISKVTL